MLLFTYKIISQQENKLHLPREGLPELNCNARCFTHLLVSPLFI
jgi:hypothetical protein